MITRTEGETHSFGELEIREICSNVVKGIKKIELKSI